VVVILDHHERAVAVVHGLQPATWVGHGGSTVRHYAGATVRTYLEKIVAAHREAAAADDRDLGALVEAADRVPAPRGFRRHLAAHDGLGVIAEIKRRSPSKGDLAPGLDPRTMAGAYVSGGAACLSVLTDADFFGGSVEDLQNAREAAGVPVLRKDFTVCANDVCDARLMGADAVLLIAAALDDSELEALFSLASDLGLDALVEVHDEPELERALQVGASLVGVNQRDLYTFTVDRGRAERMAALIPDGVVAVAESGVQDATDATSLAAAGYDAVLVGESLVTSADPTTGVASLSGHPVGKRSKAGAGATGGAR
jgi:indole-3-glycerol phosphate synthase